MIFSASEIGGVFVLDPERREDARGYFARAWCAEEFAAHGITTTIAQINVGYSKARGTLRGIHYQTAPHEECKVVRCTRGRVLDVAVDLRAGSPTRNRWHAAELTEENGRVLVVPEGCGHAYLTLEPDSEIEYLTSCAYVPSAATGARFDDPAFGIAWPSAPAVISDQDRNWPLQSPIPS